MPYLKPIALAVCAATGLAAVGAGSAARATNTGAYTPVVSTVITREKNHRWTAEFTFDVQSPVWIFHRSNVTRVEQKSWRQMSWEVLTPGVKLKRLGFYDALVADSGAVPAKVRIRFRPFAEDLLADYDPALAFTDGSVALFTGHYDVAPMKSEEAAAALPSHLGGVSIENDGPARVAFRTEQGTVLFGGKRTRGVTLIDADSYVMFGDAKTVDAPSITTILDPQLPAVMSAEISKFTPRLLSFYQSKLGSSGELKPTVMVSWAGPTKGLRSLGGSVLPALVVMRLEGEALTRSDRATLDSARWLIAHETAHFWAGQAVRYAAPREAWITEGGADLLAMRAVAELDNGYDVTAELQRSLDDCVKLAAKPISEAGDRNEHRAYYACGAMFGLAAEAAARRSGGDFFTFWRGLIDANRADGVVSRREWLTELSRLSGTNEAARIIAEMLDKPTPDAAARLEELFRLTGVAAHRNAARALILS